MSAVHSMCKAILMKILLLVLLLHMQAFAKTPYVGVTTDWEPFYSKNLPGKGFLTQVVVAAFNAVNISYDVEFTPWKRALRFVESGQRIILHGAFYNKEREEKMYYSDPFFHSEVYFVQRASSDLINTSFENLKDSRYRIGVVLGGFNGDEFEKAKDDLSLIYYSKYSQGVKLLNEGRVDLLLESKFTIKYYMELAKLDLQSFIFHKKAITREGLYLAFSKKIKGAKKLRDKFNEGLRVIKSNGSYHKIIAEQGVPWIKN